MDGISSFVLKHGMGGCGVDTHYNLLTLCKMLDALCHCWIFLWWCIAVIIMQNCPEICSVMSLWDISNTSVLKLYQHKTAGIYHIRGKHQYLMSVPQNQSARVSLLSRHFTQMFNNPAKTEIQQRKGRKTCLSFKTQECNGDLRDAAVCVINMILQMSRINPLTSYTTFSE